MITLNSFWAGFLKQLLMVVIGAVVLFLTEPAHLTGIVSPTIAVIIAGIFSGIESNMKASAGGSTALFGAVKVK